MLSLDPHPALPHPKSTDGGKWFAPSPSVVYPMGRAGVGFFLEYNCPMHHKRATPSAFKNAKELRRNLTPAEKKLWRYLRDHQLNGFGFRRQHALGPFIVDFCYPASRITIELDGHSHADQVE